MNGDSYRKPLPAGRWWERASGIVRFYPKARGMTLNEVRGMLDLVKEWGFDSIEVFAPYAGGREYSGLDVRDYYQVDPAIGTMADFLSLVQAAHARNLAVIAFVNLGYGAMDFPVFLKACADIRAGIDSPETHWFLWSDTGLETLDKSRAPHFMNDVHGQWHYSERAGKYYWVKWRGTGNNVDLPQFNFGDQLLQGEIRRAVTFWMDTGIDGMIIDAVNWYINCDWQINNETMTDVIHRYGEKYIQPEGAGGFEDDPVLWITHGRYNSVQDYGLSIWWTDRYIIGDAIQSGDPSGIETALRNYRDRVVAAGGVTYIGPRWGRRSLKDSGLSLEQKLLEAATVASVGELFHAEQALFELDWPEAYLADLKRLIRSLQAEPALQAAGSRQCLSTGASDGCYVFLRASQDGRRKALVALNFRAEDQQVAVLRKGIGGLSELLSRGATMCIQDEEFHIQLSPYGYGIYTIYTH